jgi:SNF2 family DNA or RNA helicase
MNNSDAVELRPHQLEAVAWMASRERGSRPHGGILADNVGAGKTFVVGGLLTAEPLWPTLVLVPKSLIWQWVDVLHRSGHGKDLVVVTARSAYATQRAIGARLVLATHGILLPAVPPAIAAIAWGRVVVDEAHCAKNPRSRTHLALCSLTAHARWALTATPVQNCAADLLALARFLGVVTADVAMVRESLVLARSRGIEGKEETNSTELTVRVVRLPLADEGPEAEAYAEAEAAYKRAATTDQEEDAEDIQDIQDIQNIQDIPKIARAGSLVWELQLRCRQAATHPALYYASMSRRCATTDRARSLELDQKACRASSASSAKLAFLVKDVAEAACGCVIFYEWTEEMRLVEAALVSSNCKGVLSVRTLHGRQSAQERDDALAAFRRDCEKTHTHMRSAVLLAQMRCACQGLNLQCATRAYMMRPHWNPAVERQAVGRLHRSGQTRPVTVLRLVATGTVDEATIRRQRRKLACVTEVMRDDEMERTMTGKAFENKGDAADLPDLLSSLVL